MSRHFPMGRYFRGFLASSDLTTPVAIPLFDADGVSLTPGTTDAAARTILQRPILDTIVIANGGTASIITIFADTNADGALAAGEELLVVSLAANAHAIIPLAEIAGRKINGATNKLFATASAASASTKITITGSLINS